ncbi:MAG: ABC transporter permease [Burkholderiaceae bacterium]|nr:ABC transporter permease [Burkholderiaceae bacterium]
MVVVIAMTALVAPMLGIRSPIEVDLANKLRSPGSTFLLGTDQAGRDLASRIVWGSRYSISIALASIGVGSLFGVSLGLIAGCLNGTLAERLITRLFDLMFSIPMLVWSIAIIGIIGTGPIEVGPFVVGNELKLIALIGASFVPALGRITYAVAMVEAKADYVRAKRALGASWIEIAILEILPNALPPVLIQATLFVGVAIIIEASLSFVGLGIQPPTPSWGTMLSDARSFIFSGHWWLPVFPGLAICLTVIGFNILGDGLRDAIDPKRAAKSMVI